VPAKSAAPAPEAAAGADIAAELDQPILFKTPTCPNCRAAMAMLDKAGVSYETRNADAERELVALYRVKQAPSLVVPTDDGFATYRGVSNIKGWIMQL
jgi:ribonucleoside-triphosphate reductase